MLVEGDETDVLSMPKIGGAHILIVAVSALVLFSDGFDAQMVSYVAPAISKQWRVTSAAFAPVFAANVFGLMLGAMLVTPLADVGGRKPVTLVCVGVFGVLSLLTTTVTSLGALAIARFASGFALGGAMPCVIAAVSDYIPQRARTRLGVLLSTAWSFGILVCGLTTGSIIQAQGWRSLFVIGGVLPLLLFPAVVLAMPESPIFLLRRGKGDRLAAIATRLGGAVNSVAPPPVRARLPVAELFRGRLLRITPLIWTGYFCSGAAVYFFLNWLPILVKDSGFQANQAAFVGSLYQAGGLLGGLALGVAVDRWGALALAVSLAAASVAIATIGLVGSDYRVLAALAAITGALVVGSQNTANAYTGSRLYPSEIRATALGSALGVLRLSGVLAGSLGAGFLLHLHLAPTSTFRVIAAPELLAAFALGGVYFATRRDVRSMRGAHRTARSTRSA